MSEHSFSRTAPPASSLAILRARLQQARHQRHWSQQELADLLGTTPLNIGRWEHGLTTPNPYFRHKLCDLFGLSEFELGLRPDPTLLREESAEPEAQQETASAPRPLIDPALPLPAAVPLVGRNALLAECKRQLLQMRSIALSAFHGLPGVGKTALALELAYDPDLRACYPDGLLWAALGPQPHLVGLLSRWGQLLGIHEDEAVRLHTPQDWMRTLRATIGSRRLLFILDDAWNLDLALACQVGGPQCAYVLTTRLPQVAQGFALHEAYPVETLEEEAGLDLLRQLAPWAVEQAPEPLRELAQAVGGLPLALSLLGHTLRQQTHNHQPRRLQATLERLQGGQARLQLGQRLAGEQRSLEAVISGSAEYLSEPARQAWAALSLLPARPHSFGEEAGLAIGGVDVEILDELSDAGILEAVGAGRYTFHQVLADYGRAQLAEPEKVAAQVRLITYSRRYAQEHRKHPDALEEEASVLEAGLEACQQGLATEELLHLTLVLAPFWRARGSYSQAERWLPQAAETAFHQGMQREEAYLRLEQGEIAIERGDYEQAHLHYAQGLTLAQQVGEREAICACLRGRSRVAYRRGAYEQAEQALREGLALARQHNLILQQAKLLFSLGTVMERLGHLEELHMCTQEALGLAQQVRDHELICSLFNNLGLYYYFLNDLAQAVHSCQDGLAVARQHGYRYMEGRLLTNLGEAIGLQGNYQQGEQYLREGLALARQLGNPDYLCLALANLGGVLVVQGEYIHAEHYLQEGLTLARHLGNPECLWESLIGLGKGTLARGDCTRAEHYLREALGLARQVGAPANIFPALVALGELALAQGNDAQAEQYLQEGLELAREVGLSVDAERGLNLLGELALARGDTEQAEPWLQEALSLARQSNNRKQVAEVLVNLGALARVRRDDAQAEQYLAEGLQLAQQMSLRPLLCRVLDQWGLLALQRGQLEEAAASFEEMLATAPEEAVVERAQAQYGLARLAALQGQNAQARQHGTQALSTLEAIGHRKAALVRHWLASLDLELTL